MAKTQNSIISRVQTHKKQAKGMITPGLSASARTKQGDHLPAIFTRFGVGKAKEASSKMQILDHRRMGKMQAETSKAFSEAIPQKFQDIQSLLHLNPNISREETIWNEIEKTLPTQESAQYEEPPQPGEMRAGSVIQKFSMMPKEGQSIESFKKQTQSLPKPASKRQAKPQKPDIKPRAKLFSQVQEVSSSKPTMGTTEHPPEQPASATDTTLQRQVDTAPAPAKKEETSSLPKIAEKEITPPVSQSAKEKPKKLVASPKKTELPLKKTQAVPKPPLKKAVETTPTRKKESVPQAKNLPSKVTREKVDDTRQPAKAIPTPKKTLQPQAPIVQRKVDKSPIVKAPKIAEKTPKSDSTERRKAEKPLIVKERPTTKETQPLPEQVLKQKEKPAPKVPPQEKAEVLSALPKEEVQEQEAPPSMALHKKLQERRSLPKAIKALEPEKILPPKQPPLIKTSPPPMLSKEKYSRQTEIVKPTEEKTEPLLDFPSIAPPPAPQPPVSRFVEKASSAPTVQRQEIARPNLQKTAPALAQKPLEMALAKTPRIMQQPAEKQKQEELKLPTKEELQLRESQKKEELLPLKEGLRPKSDASKQGLTSNISFSNQKVLQRQPDDDTSDAQPLPEAAPQDLNQLAEDVLPFVKRILEIESERIPGNWR